MLETRSFVPWSLVSRFAEDAFSSTDMLVSIFSDHSEDNILLTFVTAYFILCLFGEMVEKDPEGWGEGKKELGSEFPSEIKSIPMAFGEKRGGVHSWINDTSITSQGGR